MNAIETIQQAAAYPLRLVQQAVSGDGDVDEAVRRALAPVRDQLGELRGRVQAAVQESVTRAVEPLVKEVANLEVEVRALRADIDDVREDTQQLRNQLAISEAREQS